MVSEGPRSRKPDKPKEFRQRIRKTTIRVGGTEAACEGKRQSLDGFHWGLQVIFQVGLQTNPHGVSKESTDL